MIDDCILVLTTLPNDGAGDEIGRKIANILVSESLAACVNRVPGILSSYQWQGKMQTDEECLLIIKTRESLYKDIENRVKQLHPYELPEIIAVSMVQGLDKYLAWIGTNTRKQNESNS